jgi:CBS domain-containing protein
MRSHVFTLFKGASVKEAAHAFELYQQRLIPVVEPDDRCAGVLDPEKMAIQMAQTNRGEELGGDTVDGFMEEPAVACAPDDDVCSVMELMVRNGAAVALVLRRGLVVGLLGWPEILLALADSDPTLRD